MLIVMPLVVVGGTRTWCESVGTRTWCESVGHNQGPSSQLYVWSFSYPGPNYRKTRLKRGRPSVTRPSSPASLFALCWLVLLTAVRVNVPCHKQTTQNNTVTACLEHSGAKLVKNYV